MNSAHGRERDHTAPIRSLIESMEGTRPATLERVESAPGAETEVVTTGSAGAAGMSIVVEVFNSVKDDMMKVCGGRGEVRELG